MSHRDRDIEPAGTWSAFRSIATATYERSTPTQRVLAFWFVPVVLLFVGGLPEQTQSQWVLLLNDPTVTDLYLSNFVHADVRHLSSNVLSFLLVMCVLFPLAALTRHLRTLGVLSVLMLTLLPVVVSLYSITTLSGTVAETVVGFSGIAAGFAGILPVFIALLVQNRVRDINVLAGTAGLMGLELSVVLWLAGIRRPSLLVLGGLSVVGMSFAGRAGDKGSRGARGYELQLLVAAAIVFAAVPVTLIVNVDAGTNVYGHLIGLTGGFFLSMALLVIQPAVSCVASFSSAG